MTVYVDYDELVRNLKQCGFQLGYFTLDFDSVSKSQIDFWYKGIAVLKVKHQGVVATSVICVNELPITKSPYSGERSDYALLIAVLQYLNTNMPENLPSVLDVFTDILFRSYDDSVTKYDRLITASSKFTDGFKALFANEIASLAIPNTSIKAIPDMSQLYTDASSMHYHIACIMPDRIDLRSTDRVTADVVVDYEEFARYKVDKKGTNDLRNLLYTLVSFLQGIFVDYKFSLNLSTINDYQIFKKPDKVLGTEFIIVGKVLCLRICLGMHTCAFFDEISKIADFYDLEKASKEDVQVALSNKLCTDGHVNSYIACELLHDIILNFPTVLASDTELRKCLFDLLRQLEYGNFKLETSQDPQSTNETTLAGDHPETDFASLALGESSVHHILPGKKFIPEKMKF